MKKLFLILLSALSLSVFAQTTPNWYTNDMRRSFYPAEQFFTGFAEGQRMNGESMEAAITRIKNAARVEMASTIRVHVQNSTVNHALSQTLRTMEGTFRQSMREFSSTTQTSVEMEIPGLQIESYRDPQSGNITAFAYVKKSMLIRQLEKKITVCLTKIETSMDQVEQFVSNGQKMQAREVASKTLPQFAEVDEAQKLLAAVDENADEESLQLEETRTLQRRLTAQIAYLKNGIMIYISCDAQLFGKQYSEFVNMLQSELVPLGCEFVTTSTKADWIITITAKARQYNMMDTGIYFSYVDAVMEIAKGATHQHIYSDKQTVKGGHSLGYEAAALQAYKELKNTLSANIKEYIANY